MSTCPQIRADSMAKATYQEDAFSPAKPNFFHLSLQLLKPSLVANIAALAIGVFLVDKAFSGPGVPTTGPLGHWAYMESYSAELETLVIGLAILSLHMFRGTPKTSKYNTETLRRPKQGFGSLEKIESSRSLPSLTRSHTSTRSQAQQAPSGSKATSIPHWNMDIDQAAKAMDPNRAEQLLLDMEKAGLCPDAISYNSVIHAWAKHGDIGRSEQWLLRMKRRGVEANNITFNILIDACAKADDADAAETWLKRMKDAGVQANVVSYATLIHARAKRGDVIGAEAWLRSMIDMGVEPNVVSYNSLIYACVCIGDAESAERWVEEMTERGVVSQVSTYNTLMDACKKCGDVARAEKWMNKMFAMQGIEPNVVSYCMMITACAQSGDLARAEHWHDRMVEYGVQPNAHIFSAVVSACSKLGDVDKAVEWIGRMEKSWRTVTPDAVVYCSAIDACFKSGDSKRAAQLFQRMKANGVRPTVSSYVALARPFAHAGDWQEVERLQGELTADGLSMNEYFLYQMLTAFANAKPLQSLRAKALFREARNEGLKANDHVLRVLGRAIGRPAASALARELADHDDPGKPEKLFTSSKALCKN